MGIAVQISTIASTRVTPRVLCIGMVPLPVLPCAAQIDEATHASQVSSYSLTKSCDNPVGESREQPVQPNECLATHAQNDFVFPPADRLDRFFRHPFGRHHSPADTGRAPCSLRAVSKNSVAVVLGLTNSTSIPAAVSSARNASLNPCT